MLDSIIGAIANAMGDNVMVSIRPYGNKDHIEIIAICQMYGSREEKVLNTLTSSDNTVAQEISSLHRKLVEKR